jgi:hypothetical protein
MDTPQRSRFLSVERSYSDSSDPEKANSDLSRRLSMLAEFASEAEATKAAPEFISRRSSSSTSIPAFTLDAAGRPVVVSGTTASIAPPPALKKST